MGIFLKIVRYYPVLPGFGPTSKCQATDWQVYPRMFAGVPCTYHGYRPIADDSRGVLYIAPLHTMALGFVIKP